MRIAIWIGLFLLALAAAPPPAEAHAFLEQATPRVGSTVGTPPGEHRLRFSEAVELRFCKVQLAKQGGETVETGPLSADAKDERVLVATIPKPLAPGVYKVTWRVVSRDTHVTSGDFTFEVSP